MPSGDYPLTPTTPRPSSELQNLGERQAPQNTNETAEIEFVVAGRQEVAERSADSFADYLNSQSQMSELLFLNQGRGPYDVVDEILNQSAFEGPRSQGDEPF
ncbi:MAG: hypothetical protein AAF318_01285 [Pseudomonadota bacterium]